MVRLLILLLAIVLATAILDLHSDPQFPDLDPGQTGRLRGRLSFYEGTEIDGELARIEATGWQTAAP